jgi:malonyl-CoA O-methyltransferase
MIGKLQRLREILAGGRAVPAGGAGSAPPDALAWLRSAELASGGIRVHSGHPGAYPEVTGYLVPTLLQLGAREQALRLVHWLISVQQADGSFLGPDDGQSYIFDTGQVLRGLLAAIEFEPRAREAARRAADYLCNSTIDQGRQGFGPRYDGSVPESVHLYLLPALVQAAELLGVPHYREVAYRCLDFYRSHQDALRLADLTHFLAYQLEALIDLGRAELALPVLRELQKAQREDGAVRGMGGQTWVCSPGLAQLAICWYKTGQREPGDQALAWLERHQTPQGGFRGSYGRRASYFPKVELSWAVKFYLDARLLRDQR